MLWNWIGVALNIAIGLLLSPYIMRKLESERYGIWVLVFSLVEYLWFFDLGFNTSVTQFVAKYRARNEPDQINRVINTGLVYFCAVAVVFALATLLVAWRGVDLFEIASPRNRQDFRVVILIVGLGWAINFPLHFSAPASTPSSATTTSRALSSPNSSSAPSAAGPSSISASGSARSASSWFSANY